MIELFSVIPFILLLLSIAFMPFIKPVWWHKNYDKVSYVLAATVVLYYLGYLHDSDRVWDTMEEYISFISLLFSLFVVSGGIYFNLNGKSTPLRNTVFLFTGAVISNLFGTTGAAMLLIRPFINSNRKRLKPFHIVFFIFIVCNVGGALTPIGDPPLFLGYLKGVPFFWVIQNLFGIWAVTIFYLLVLFLIVDAINYKKYKATETIDEPETVGNFKIEGYWNFIFLFMIIGAVFITEPIFFRELIMLSVAAVSYKLTPKRIQRKNDFNFGPIREVAVLFIGIFMTMIPALELLTKNAKTLGLNNPGDFFWASGILTSFLDNAPTYLNFLAASMGLHDLAIDNAADVLKFVKVGDTFLVAISVASVFFGAMTYIGNGPNFMVKSISDYSGVKMPSFVTFMVRYSLIILLPFYFLLWYFLFR